jgi:hypothetical protein
MPGQPLASRLPASHPRRWPPSHPAVRSRQRGPAARPPDHRPLLTACRSKPLKTAQEAGIRFPDFLTHAIYDAYVTVPSRSRPAKMKPSGYP